jgi:succinate-semialdehyde dehydrogenase/glutarate-semialdehyde dehydrogenase
MKTQSVNPFNDELINEFELWTEGQIETALAQAEARHRSWRKVDLVERLRLVSALSRVLLDNKQKWARVITDEMGKTLKEADSEIEKCAFTCQFLSENLPEWFASEKINSSGGNWEVLKEPMGVLVGIMPWNFPFWQVLRFAVPAVSLGNTVILKHASNVFGCSQAIAEAFALAGFPQAVFQHAPLSSQQILKVIPDNRVRGVSLTGSTAAGRAVGEAGGRSLKKVVLELGGSDAYVILDDANLELAVTKCVSSRLLNAGQSCVSAKRFIVTKKNADLFEKMFTEKMKHNTCGNPNEAGTDLGPLARKDLRDQLHSQVQSAVIGGAKLALGGHVPFGKGSFYPPTVLLGVDENNPIFREETFGPVATIISAESEDHAIELANKSSYGLGSAIFSANVERARELARHHLEAGMSFVNDFVKSDVRVPFGGIKDSGVGRELGRLGVVEFANIKSILS